MNLNLNKVLNIVRVPGIWSLLMVVLLPLLLNAQSPLIRVKAEVDSSLITIGDRVTYSLTVEHQSNIRIEQPGPGANLGQFEIKDYSIHEPVENNDLISQRFEYQISVFDTGTFVIPPFPVAFWESDTTKDYQIIQSEPIEITVESVVTAEDREIRDIKQPQGVPARYGKWILLGCGLLVIAGAAGFLFYYFKQRKKGIPLFKKEKIRPAHEIALEELANIRSQWKQLLETGQSKLLFTRISQVSRRYLENRFFIQALEETTFEISDSVDALILDENDQLLIMAILQLSDHVKFAKYSPNEKEVLDCLNWLETFIDHTKLEFETVEHKVESPQTETEHIEAKDTEISSGVGSSS